jgi:hypothetical protein
MVEYKHNNLTPRFIKLNFLKNYYILHVLIIIIYKPELAEFLIMHIYF